MRWLRIRELVRKEFIQIFRDRKNRPFLIVAPLVQLIVFGYVVTTDVRDIRVGLFDQARTPESRRLIDAIDGNKTFRITHYPDHRRISTGFCSSARSIWVLSSAGFQLQDPARGNRRDSDPGRRQHEQYGSHPNILYQCLLEGFNRRLIRELYPRRIDYGEIDARIRTWYNPNLESQYFYVPGIVAFLVMLLSLLFTSMAIVREKEAGTMEQLIVTPMRPIELILGKTIPFIIIAQAQMIMVALFAMLWFRIPMAGNAFLFLGATCIFLLSTLGIGLFISTVSQTQQQAMMTNFFFILPFFMLSGFVFPISNMPVACNG